MEGWANQLVQGVLLGGLYALLAAGLVLCVGVLRFVNIAHGDFIVLGSFALPVLSSALGLNPFLAAVFLAVRSNFDPASGSSRLLIAFEVVVIGSLEGPILGTLVYFALRQYLAGLGTAHLMVLGTLSIAVILIEPRGLWGLIRRFLPGDLIPTARVPARPRPADPAAVV